MTNAFQGISMMLIQEFAVLAIDFDSHATPYPLLRDQPIEHEPFLGNRPIPVFSFAMKTILALELTSNMICIQHSDLDESSIQRRHSLKISPSQLVERRMTTDDIVNKRATPASFSYQSEQLLSPCNCHIEKPSFLILNARDIITENTQEDPIGVEQRITSLRSEERRVGK